MKKDLSLCDLYQGAMEISRFDVLELDIEHHQL